MRIRKSQLVSNALEKIMASRRIRAKKSSFAALLNARPWKPIRASWENAIVEALINDGCHESL
jgi:hypothetical protein